MIARNTHNPSGLFDELIVDNFAGGGGASIGIERAIGRAVDVSINHSPEAVAMHRANHPHTLHLCQDVWEVNPIEATGGRPVGLAWFSPDCTYHSKARGGKPFRDEKVKCRDLAWVVLRWAGAVRPRVIMLENVEEFRDWGPLTRKRGRAKHPRPCRFRRGRTYQHFKDQLIGIGYDVQDKTISACDYGAPTIRKRLFLIARCDGQPIVWPEATHGAAERTASTGDRTNGELCNRGRRADSTDQKSPSLRPYRTAAECIDWTLPCPSIFDRAKPLADNTLKRIAAGIKRYVIDAAEPFIVRIGQTGGNGSYTNSTQRPLTTVTTKAEHCLVVPTLVTAGYGEREGQAPRVPGLHKPLGTLVGTSKHALVSAFIVKHFGGMVGVPATTPLPTITARGTQNQLATAHMIKLRGTCKDGQDLRQPAPTVTASGTHAGLVAALLVKYYGTDQDPKLDQPLHTITTKDRFGLVTVYLQGEPYVITDIGMRMLQPHELYRAQGFPNGYIIDHGITAEGERIKLTKTTQVRLCGNSVSPPVAEALVRANMVDVPVAAGEVAA